jgi:uncharacterized protein
MNVPAALHRALVDTSAYYALTDRGENTHQAALQVQQVLIEQRFRLFTTNFILAETHALLLNRLGYHIALRVLTEIDRSRTTIVRVTVADEKSARALLMKYNDKVFSLTDAISFVVMERLAIPQAFTFDRDFLQYGFPPLLPVRQDT